MIEHDSAYSMFFTQPVFYDYLEPHHKQMKDLLIPKELNYDGLIRTCLTI